MDAFQEYKRKICEITKVITDCLDERDLINKINESKAIDLESDIAVILSNLKIMDPLLTPYFEEEIINRYGIGIITRNMQEVGVEELLLLSSISENQELEDYINENLQWILDKIESIDLQCLKKLILGEKVRENPKLFIPKIIKIINCEDRKKLLELILQNPDLGAINDYLSDFFNTERSFPRIGRLLVEMEKKQEIDDLLLLQTVAKNMKNIMENYYSFETIEFGKFIDELIKIEGKIPEENLELAKTKQIIKETVENNLPEILEKYNYNVSLIERFRKLNIDNSILKQFQENIAKAQHGIDLIKYIQSCKNAEGFDLNWNFEDVVNHLFKEGEEPLVIDAVDKKMISRIIEELCESQGVGIKDLEFAGAGFYSQNIKIGDYVLKLGRERITNEIRKHRRIIKPIIRQQTNIAGEKNVPNLFVEVQNAVDTKWYEGMSEEEVDEVLYQIYKELMDESIVWTDIKPENIGRLLKPNKENLTVYGEEIQSSDYAIGFIGERKGKILRPGELVVIDTDYIYKKGEEVGTPLVSKFKEFSERYEKERKRDNKLKIKKLIEDGKYDPVGVKNIKEMFAKEKLKNRGEEKEK